MINELTSEISFTSFKEEVLKDYEIVCLSRAMSLLGRKEVLTGKAKFGIFGDGKELPQIAMAKAFQKGDFRSGYYRDQTFMMAIDSLTPQQLFAGLYAHTDPDHEPMSSGRQMGGHYNTDLIDKNGTWLRQTDRYNSSSDVSCTAAQMPRLVGLAMASKLYRTEEVFHDTKFSVNGKEVAWGTIGNASTSEGLFFESLNAAGVHQIPMVISVWDDEYGISVDNSYQTIKGSISEALAGFQRSKTKAGFEIFTVKGWDYPNLIHTFQKAGELSRTHHVPVLIHVTELTQPQGHSTSGSHERYKSEERLEWEKENDCNRKFRTWILDSKIATEAELNEIEKSTQQQAKQAKNDAWEASLKPIREEAQQLVDCLAACGNQELIKEVNRLIKDKSINRKKIASLARKSLRTMRQYPSSQTEELQSWTRNYFEQIQPKFSSNLYNETQTSSLQVDPIRATYDEGAMQVDGRIILRDNFKALFERNSKLLVFGEDTGKIGDVNQGLEGLQSIFGVERVADRGIREATIIGEGIGMALRGLRPIAEIQYLDYVLYALQVMSDDLATLHYRTNGKQVCPLIVRTRGHRLEGIWHSGSPMGGLVHNLRGMYILVPRNMTQAAGMYNTLLKGNDPALVIESLNGYRLKEKLPNNLGEFCVPLGTTETMRKGKDITLVSYGSTLRIVLEAAEELHKMGVDIEVIDIQSLIPFDLSKDIRKSIEKTNRLLIIDEDVPGGGATYILNELLEKQHIFPLLDSKPETLSAKAHRPAYGSDGDYFSKPSLDDILEAAYKMMHEYDPKEFPKLN
ncbi:MAG: thiamine pyrophosphate-dependent enzyme [Flavobacteriaceae bacterium]|nr:thiamine pyrophosphate-dependent enzyme [Flavobacteriaceae bacterium]